MLEAGVKEAETLADVVSVTTQWTQKEIKCDNETNCHQYMLPCTKQVRNVADAKKTLRKKFTNCTPLIAYYEGMSVRQQVYQLVLPSV